MVETGPASVCTPGDYTVPGPPNLDEPGDGAPPMTRIVLAIEKANFGETADPDAGFLTPPGLDLDCVDTCFQGTASSCVPPNAAAPPCDGVGGRDTRANNLFNYLAEVEPGLGASVVDSDVGSGKFGVVFRIDNYQGGPNQEQVVVEAFPSAGTVEQVGDAYEYTPAKHDGTDLWSYTSSAGTTAGFSTFLDMYAYVTDGVLVFHFPTFPLLLLPDVGGNMNPLSFDLVDVVGSVTLVEDASGQWHGINGNVAGRWAATDALKGASTLSDNIEDIGDSICGCDAIYRTYWGFICGNVDIATNASSDNTGAPCDALSFGFGFTLGPANLTTDPVDPSIVPPDCPAGWAPSCAPADNPATTCD